MTTHIHRLYSLGPAIMMLVGVCVCVGVSVFWAVVRN